MDNELLIPFESFSTRGVQKDTEMKTRSSSSFFYNIYLQTYKLIEQIDHDNQKYSARRSKRKYNNDSSQDLNSVQNIIAFTGRRGTGKTSAMLSIVDSLTCDNFSEDFREENYKFLSKGYITFPYIDAAMMAKKEDIFEVVLSKMVTCAKEKFGTPFDRKSRYYDHQTDIDMVFEKICKVYDHYSRLMSVELDSKNSGYSFMEVIADKHNVREEFIDLVKDYTTLFSVTKNEKDCYLVICIDDIDMSLPNCMAIMQCIHQYFMIPKVIVMISLNFPLLSATLQNDFYTKIFINDSTKDEHEYQMNLTRGQTYDFLKKIIPPDMRITMPSWKKRDYLELFPSVIDFGTADDKAKIISMFPNLEDSVLIKSLDTYKGNNRFKLLPKDLIMLMIANRTKCFLDINGYKIHFMQPDSLRNMNDLFYLFYNMENIIPLKKDDGDNNEYYKKREENRKVILDYLNFKMLQEYSFDPEILAFLDLFLASPIERRGRIVWEYYHKLLSKKENEGRIVAMYNSNVYLNECERFKVEDFSFGELFRSFYFSTRLSIFSRDLVKFLLASFSFTMPQFMEKERKADKYFTPKNESSLATYDYVRTREAFSYSLIGTWCKDLFSGNDLNLVIYKKKLINDVFSKVVQKNKEELKSTLKNIVYLFLLCSSSSQKSIEVQVVGEKYIIHAKVDPTAFILNSLRLEKRIIQVKFDINKKGNSLTFYDLLSNICFGRPESEKAETKNKNYFDELMRRVLEIDNITDLKEYFEKNYILMIRDELIDSKVLPVFLFKHTDMSYNVIKRVIRSLLYTGDNNVEAKETPSTKSNVPVEIIKEFYKRLINALENEDKGYLLQYENEDSFANILKSNPVVGLFYENAVIGENSWVNLELDVKKSAKGKNNR